MTLAAGAFERKAYHRPQVTEEREAGGGLVVTLELAMTPETNACVRGWGAAVEVVEPASLRARIAEQALETWVLYAPPSAWLSRQRIEVY